MYPRSMTRLACLAAALCTLPTAAVWATSPAETFHEAYYLQHAEQNFAAAAKLYEQVAGAASADAALKAQAASALAACREELAAADLMRLMPSETMVYLELNDPGAQLTRLLDVIGLLGTADRGAAAAAGPQIRVSPTLVKELLGLRGLAVALTGFDSQAMRPTGVAVLNPGNLEIIRGALETALPVGAAQTEPIAGYPAYFIDDPGIHVCLAAKLVVAGTSRNEIEGVLARVRGANTPSFGDGKQLSEVISKRDGSLLYVCLDAKRLVPMLSQQPGFAENLAPARAFLDLDSLQWVAARAGVDGDGLFLDFAAQMDQGHHNFVYNLVRTPPITRQTFANVPAGAAGFVAAALSAPGARPGEPMRTTGDAQPAMTGLDIGREIFANVVDFAIFALPPTADGRSEQPHIPDVGGVIRVNDPARSEALWNQLLGLASMAAGSPTNDGSSEQIAGVEARTYRFPDGVSIFVATLDDKLLVATTHQALARTVAAARGGASILNDDAFAPSLQQVDAHTSKVVLVNPGRCLTIARQFMNDQERAESAPFVDMLAHTVASIMTTESEQQFRIAGRVTGLPKMGPFLAEMIEREHHSERMRHELHRARREGDWDRALRLVDEMMQHDRSAEWFQTKFEILALGKGDRQAAMDCAREFVERTASNAQALNRFAWDLLTEDQYAGRFNELALGVAEKACELTNYHNWAILDTLALAKFNDGQVDAAIELQEKAVNLHGGHDDQLVAALDRYRAARHGR